MSESFEDKREEALEEEDSFEESTIFSAPVEKHDKVKKPKLLRKILMGAGVLIALAAAIVAIVMLVAEMTGDDDTQDVVLEWYLLGDYVTVNETTGTDGTVTKTETFNFDAFSTVLLKSENMTLDFYAKEGDSENANIKWLEKTIPEAYTSETTVGGKVKAALGLKYTRIISETLEDEALYGFDKPTYTIQVAPNEGDAFTVTVGKQSPDQSGYYVTVSNGTKVYLVRSSYIEELLCEDKMDLTKAMSVAAFSETEGSAEYYVSGALATFDHLYFTNSNLNEIYKFVTVDKEQNDIGYSYNTYRIVEPTERAANDTGIVPIIELFSNGVSSTGLYTVSKTDEDIKKFGLDNPDMTVSIKAGKQERELKAKLQKDGYYALVSSDMDVILKVSSDNLTPATLTEKDIYSATIFIETLADLKDITILADGAKMTFGIVTEYDEENDTNNITGITVNGGEVTAPEEFQSYYRFLLGISVINYDTTDIAGKTPAATITMTRKDGTVSYVIKYYEAQNGRYQAVVNGDQMGLIGSSNFKNIIKYAKNVAEGKLYNS